MGELEYQKDSRLWVWGKGILKRCRIHHIDYDPNVGCPKCHQQDNNNQTKLDLKRMFPDVIWPED